MEFKKGGEKNSAAGGNFLGFLTSETSFFNDFLLNQTSNPEKFSAFGEISLKVSRPELTNRGKII